jgi:signal transduction histidine kinase
VEPALRVLWVGCEERERELVQLYLERAPGPPCTLRALGDPAALRERLARGDVDCVLLSHAPPQLDALHWLGALGAPAEPLPVPVIVLDAQGSSETALASLRAGAQDCASCARLTPEGLGRSVRNAVEKGRLEREVRARQHELELAHRRELELKHDLIANVSHELRTPLTAIQQFLTIVLDGLGGPLAERQREYLGIALRNAHALRELIDDLLEASRCQHDQLGIEPRVIRAETVVQESAASLRVAAEQRGLALSVHCAADLPWVLADPARVRQITCNLVENAIQFTPAGRAVRVGVHSAADEPGFVAVSVEDEGCGIRPERLPLVFERLHQEPSAEHASRRGLGLGLYIARELVRGQGGEIRAQSELGAGSRFVFTLPAFSLGGLLRAALRAGRLAGDALFLLALRLAPAGAAPLEEAERARLYRVLQRSVYAESDWVLPRFAPGPDGGEEFYVVAVGGREAAEGMTRRLRRTLSSAEGVDPARFSLQIAGKPLGAPAPASEPDAWLRVLGARLGVVISTRRAGHRYSDRGRGSDILPG